MRNLPFFSFVVVLVGCSASESRTNDDNDENVSATSVQLNAYRALQSDTGRAWKWVQHERFGTPTHLSGERRGEATLLAGANPEATTVAFLRRYKTLFGMHAPENELSLVRTDVDALAMTHVRMQQHVHGIPVVGAQLFAHYDRRGLLTAVDAQYVPDLSDLDINPSFEAKVAVDVALKDAVSLMNGIDEKALAPNAGRLVVFAPSLGAARLAYEVKVDAQAGNEPAIWITKVDAKTGIILDRYNNIQTLEGSGQGVFGDTKKLQVSQTGNGFSLVDTSRGVTIQTSSSNGQQVTADQGATLVTSTSATSWDSGTIARGAAVDAHFYAGVVFDYYKKHHDRNGIDGVGGPMLSAVHYGQSYQNAFWNGASMTYGDGGQFLQPLAGAVDTVGHEFTHGVTERTSNLDYQTQSGALNESISDIFAAFIEHDIKPDDSLNWQQGEAIAKTNEAPWVRDFKTPSRGGQPDHLTKFVQTQQDNGGVHTNSGIPNNAAYLMTMGGKNPTSGKGPSFGIGYAKSEKIWYRANTTYLRSTSDFSAAAQATMQSAKDLALTPNEQNIVDCAWKATGVVQGECATIVDPKSTTPGDDGDPTTSADQDGTGPGPSSGSDEGEGDSTKSPKRKTPSTSAAPAAAGSTGCNVAAGQADHGPLAGLLLALVGLARKRRQRPCVNGS